MVCSGGFPTWSPTLQYGDIMTRVYVPNMDYDTQEVVGARPGQFVILPDILAPSPVCVGEHVELKGKLTGFQSSQPVRFCPACTRIAVGRLLAYGT